MKNNELCYDIVRGTKRHKSRKPTYLPNHSNKNINTMNINKN
jgi:hypothetical protein